LPALGFFEWQVQADGKSKRPFYITLNDQDVFGFAGLWDSSTGADGVAVESCTIVTMAANHLQTLVDRIVPERDLTCQIELKAVPGRQNRWPGVASPRRESSNRLLETLEEWSNYLER
jgi:hypothetical protein